MKKTSINGRVIIPILIILLMSMQASAWKTPPPIPVGIYGFIINDSQPMVNITLNIMTNNNIIINTTSRQIGFFEAQIPWDDPDTEAKEGIPTSGANLTFVIDRYKVADPKNLYLDLRNAGQFILINITTEKKALEEEHHSGGSHSGGSHKGDSSVIIQPPASDQTQPSKNNITQPIPDKDNSIQDTPNKENTTPSLPDATTPHTYDNTTQNGSYTTIPSTRKNLTLIDFINMSDSERIEHSNELADSMPVFPLPNNKSIKQRAKDYEQVSTNHTPHLESPNHIARNYSILTLYAILVTLVIILIWRHRTHNNNQEHEDFKQDDNLYDTMNDDTSK